MIGHALVCASIHNLDERKHAQFRAKTRASLAMILRYHEPPAKACPMGGQYQPQQSSEIQMCKPVQYQSSLWPRDGSSRGM